MLMYHHGSTFNLFMYVTVVIVLYIRIILEPLPWKQMHRWNDVSTCTDCTQSCDLLLATTSYLVDIFCT